MAFDYTKAHTTAARLLKNFGQELNLSRVTSSYDPTTGADTVTVVDAHSCQMVSLPASQALSYFDNRTRQRLEQGKARFFIGTDEANGFQPEPGDLLEYESAVWEVVGATPLKPADTQVLFTLGVTESGLSAIPVAP